jgi:catechol 2,3-dioxygenase-like lactoylglutathione lyase family enzyme
MNARSLLALAVLSAVPSFSQLAAPNEAGVAAGHVHLLVKDVEVQKKFWTSTMGGTAVQNGGLALIQFPGVFIMLRQGDPKGGTVGSVVNHFGFYVKDIKSSLAKWKAEGIKIEQANNPQQAFLTGPDDLRIEIFEDPSITTPIKMHHIHLSGPATQDMQAWYAKTFGGVPGKRGTFETDNLPGVEMAFTKSEAQVGTRGRSLDHIGFDVKSIDAFSKRLESQGLKFDAAIREVPNTKTRVAFLTDPWGTYIEITENLAPAK